MLKGTIHGDKLQAIREHAGVGRKQLAEAAGCSVSHLWHVETVPGRYASVELLNRIATHLSRFSGRQVELAEFYTPYSAPAPVECGCACRHSRDEPVSA